uniref:F-box protein At3g62230 n=1 Tax=Anthurium amnicola TaxID=1678845 RepID=A0A1D1XKE1_9ARAE
MDRTDKLPDPILGHILSFLPAKLATRTSILSSRWRDLWKHAWASATTLDFTGDFARRQTPDQLVASVDRHLHLHTGNKISTLRVSLHPAGPYQEHLDRWIEFAAARWVEELDLDFCPPGEEINYDYVMADGERHPFKIPNALYSSGSLTHLTLGFCNLCPPVDFGSFRLLKSLSFRCVNVDDAMLRGALADCPLLETLSLRECVRLSSIEIASPTTRLKRLVLVDCWEIKKVWVLAPSVESFRFFGEIYCLDFSFDGASSLADAFICSIGRESSEPEHDYLKLLSELAHVRILTVCPATLSRVTIWEEFMEEDYLPVPLESLQELQLLMHTMNAEYLSYIYGFLRLCPSPFLEKLFIRLPKVLEDPTLSSAKHEVIEGPQSVSFEHLKTVKMTNFKGSHSELELVKFLLARATNLEYMVLVAPPIPMLDDDRSKLVEYLKSESRIVANLDLKALYTQLVSLPKASSHVQIVLSKYQEADSSLNPTHSSVCCDEELNWWM